MAASAHGLERIPFGSRPKAVRRLDGVQVSVRRSKSPISDAKQDTVGPRGPGPRSWRIQRGPENHLKPRLPRQWHAVDEFHFGAGRDVLPVRFRPAV